MAIRRNPPLPVQRLVIPYSYCFCLYDGLFTVVILSAGSIFPSGTLGATTFYRCCPNPHYHTFAPSPTVLLRPHLRQHLKLDLVFLATATESGVLVLALIWCRPVRSRLRPRCVRVRLRAVWGIAQNSRGHVRQETTDRRHGATYYEKVCFHQAVR